MPIKNQRTAYFSLRALTTLQMSHKITGVTGPKPQDLRGYCTKVYQFFNQVDKSNGIAIFPSIVECQRTE